MPISPISNELYHKKKTRTKTKSEEERNHLTNYEGN